jgi:hypothetical protein
LRHRPASQRGHCARLFSDAGFDEGRAGLTFNIAAAWLVGAINQELILMRELRQGRGFAAADVPAELAFLPAFNEACLAIPAIERFTTGLEVLLAGIEAQLDPARPPARRRRRSVIAPTIKIRSRRSGGGRSGPWVEGGMTWLAIMK